MPPATSALQLSNLRLTPEDAARRLRARPGFLWLDSAATIENGERPISLLTADPRAVLTGHLSDVSELRAALATLPSMPGTDCGLTAGGLFGYVEFDGRFTFGLYPDVLVFDHESERWFEAGHLSAAISAELPRWPALPPIDFAPRLPRSEFVSMVRRALDYIGAGDIYQVNLSHPFSSSWPAGEDAFPFYERLRHFSPAPQAAFIDLGGRQILSSSPELFLRLSGRFVRTRPIKGTRPRRRDAQEDERSAYDLITSQKEIAELLMITDLERNDLGQVCEYGTVTVPELLKLERFEHVFHLVSTVQGMLRPDVDHLETLRACFPGGSISGAPKKRALEIIAELERFPRGLYTGAIGWIGANGESQFSIAIRTAVVDNDHLHFHSGAGIVADSQPEREYEETWHKAVGILGAASWGTARARPAEGKSEPAGTRISACAVDPDVPITTCS